MTGFGAKAWVAALTLSLALHGVLALRLTPPDPGDVVHHRGQPTTVAGSLGSILGGIESSAEVSSEPVETVKPAEVAPSKILDAQVVEPQTTQPSAPTPTGTSAAAPQPPTSEVKARSPGKQTRSHETAPSAARTRPRDVTPEEARETAPTVAKPVKPRRTRTRKKTANPKTPRKRRARSRAGSNTQGSASKRRGGQVGRRQASVGSVRNYGARVRARILSFRPNAYGRGSASISFGVSPGGALRYARIARSSGDRALDRAALASVRRAAPFPRPPRGASPSQLRFRISFSFR